MDVWINGKTVKLPDFLLVGAAKAGTTTLYHYFRQHPEIYVGKMKEPHFFALQEKQPSFTKQTYIKEKIWELSFYLNLFKQAKEFQKIGDCSPSYLACYNVSIEHIKKIYGKKYHDIKILIILRNPIDTAFSHYLHQVKRFKDDLTFEEAIKPEVIKKRVEEHPQYDYIGAGMYYHQVEAYVENFKHVKICFFEDLKNINSLLHNIFIFFEVEDISDKLDQNFRANPSGIPKSRLLLLITRFITKVTNKIIRVFLPKKYGMSLQSKVKERLLKFSLTKPEMDIRTRKELMYIYKDDILKLQKFIKKDLSHWLAL